MTIFQELEKKIDNYRDLYQINKNKSYDLRSKGDEKEADEYFHRAIYYLTFAEELEELMECKP